MLIDFYKYHALKNDFIVIEQNKTRFTKNKLSKLALSICDRRAGVGADGIVYLSGTNKEKMKIDIYNADGSWAEKSGNGLRIAGVHCYLNKNKNKKRNFFFQTANSIDKVSIIKKVKRNYLVKTGIGEPLFDTVSVPIKSKLKYMINSPLKVGNENFPVTCLSVGNPHTVLLVDNFDFDWQSLGTDIENNTAFPEKTNVEFVKIINRHKIKVADWERGAGATGSSGTGAAASVCAGVIMGLLDRQCEVVFESGSLFIDWSEKTNIIELTGSVTPIAKGTFDFR